MGVFGIIGQERTNVASSVYYGLFALQHRGQESCGIVVNDDGVFNMKRDTGLVNDVFSHADLEALGLGNMAQHCLCREGLLVQPHIMQHILHDPLRICGVIDGEAAGIAQLVTVPPQDAAAGGMEGHGPHIQGLGP